MSIRDYIGRNAGDWPTENEENGNYTIRCDCGVECLGPKRATQCYPCHVKWMASWEDTVNEGNLDIILVRNQLSGKTYK